MGSTAVLADPPAVVPPTTDPPSGAPPRRPRGRIVVGVVVLGLLVVFALGGGRDGANHLASTAQDAASDGVAKDALSPAPESGGTTGGTGGTVDATASVGAPATRDAVTGPDLTADSAKVVKTGSIDLEVPKGSFSKTVRAITSRAVGLGGYVADATTNEADARPSGSVVVRVPAGSFDDFMAQVRKFGKVRSVTSKGTEVTAQYADLQARLSALGATRDRLTTLLGQAKDVGEILQVQDRMTAVQTEIEQYQGQLRLLDDQTSMATLSITLAEPGATPVDFEATRDGGIGGAWADARDRFGDGIEAIVSGSGVAGVFALVGVVLFGLGRLLLPRLRRPTS